MQKRLPVSETLRVRAGARATGRKPQTRLGLAQAETVWVAQKVAGTAAGRCCWHFLPPPQNVLQAGGHGGLSQPGVLGRMAFRSLLALRTFGMFCHCRSS